MIDAIIFLKHLRCVIIETPLAIAMHATFMYPHSYSK